MSHPDRPLTGTEFTAVHDSLARVTAALSFLKAITKESSDQQMAFYGADLQAVFELIHDEADRAFALTCNAH